MPEFHVTCPGREATFTEPAEVAELLRRLDREYADAGRSVLVGIDAESGSLDVGLGTHHTAMVITTPEEPGFMALGDERATGERPFEFDGDTTPIPAVHLIPRADAFAALTEFLATGARPANLRWQEF